MNKKDLELDYVNTLIAQENYLRTEADVVVLDNAILSKQDEEREECRDISWRYTVSSPLINDAIESAPKSQEEFKRMWLGDFSQSSPTYEYTIMPTTEWKVYESVSSEDARNKLEDGMSIEHSIVTGNATTAEPFKAAMSDIVEVTSPCNYINVTLTCDYSESMNAINAVNSIQDLNDMTAEELDEAWDQLIDSVDEDMMDGVPFIDTEDLTDAELDQVIEQGLPQDVIDTILTNKDQLRKLFSKSGVAQQDMDELERIIGSAERVKNGQGGTSSNKDVGDAFDYAMEILG